MSSTNKLESSLDDLFKNAPKLPENGKKALVKYLPWINLVLGLLTLWTAWLLWHWAHTVNTFINYANSLSQSLGGSAINVQHMSATVWIGLVVLIVEGVLFVAAFPGTRDHKKSGWNLLFYAALVNLVYAIVIMFSSYGGFGSLISGVIGTVIGLYFLFQIREYYLGEKSKA